MTRLILLIILSNFEPSLTISWVSLVAAQALCDKSPDVHPKMAADNSQSFIFPCGAPLAARPLRAFDAAFGSGTHQQSDWSPLGAAPAAVHERFARAASGLHKSSACRTPLARDKVSSYARYSFFGHGR